VVKINIKIKIDKYLEIDEILIVHNLELNFCRPVMSCCLVPYVITFDQFPQVLFRLCGYVPSQTELMIGQVWPQHLTEEEFE
jgi:hypothetical protein